MDVGHGQGSFDWLVAEVAMKNYDFYPDTISSDMHSGNINDGAVKDLAHVMSKFLALGMPLEDVRQGNTLFL